MPKWYDEARKEMGVKEAPGKRNNPAVVRYYAEAGHPGVKHDSVAWCAAFANAMLHRAGIEGTGKLTARSFLNWGVKLDRPVKGCIVVFKRGNSSWQGHVAFYVSETSTHIQCRGGNQSDAVNVRSYPKSKLLGHRWPEGVPIPATPARPKKPPKKKARKYLRVNMRGDDVRRMQKVLRVEPDGIFGKRTRAAVWAYQKKHGLLVDGIAGPQTLGSMGLA